jgi:3-hydroxypropanoate dehydrogenase
MTQQSHSLNDAAKNQLFLDARTYNGWLDKPVSDEILHEMFDLTKMGPTSANCSPMRIVFVKTQAAKERLKPFLMEANVGKTMSAPVTAIIAHDIKFYDHLPKLFPHTDAKSWFVGNDDLIKSTAFRNGTLQGAYLMLAARTLGLDCGAMSGFDAKGVQQEFFAGKDYEVNFLCNIGYGDPKSIFPRSPRFAFDDVNQII